MPRPSESSQPWRSRSVDASVPLRGAIEPPSDHRHPVKVAVTGGSGFIGSNLVDALVSGGHRPVVIDLLPPHRGDVAAHQIDILDESAWGDALDGCDAVFHLAAVANVNDAYADPARCVELNVLGTARTLDAALRAGVRRFVLASTVWVYNAALGDGLIHEDATMTPSEVGHVYTASKLAAEMTVHSYAALYGQEFTILRYGIPYGPRMRNALAIPQFIAKARVGEPITIQGDGSSFRRYLYVEDLAAAHLLALGSAGQNQVFNLEGDVAVSMREMVDAIGEAMDCELDVEYGPARPGDFTGREVSAKLAESQLGWRPTTSFADGLRRYLDWLSKQGPTS